MIQSRQTITDTFNALTSDAKEFIHELCKVAGNQVHTAEELAYYMDDLYTWFNTNDLLPLYTKSEIGGFMNSLLEKGIVQNDYTEKFITEFGVQVAILVAAEIEKTSK